MANSNGWQTERTALEVLREGSDPAAYDVEYTVEYSFKFRFDEDGECEAEFDAFGPIEYYPDENTIAKITIADVTPETRDRFVKLATIALIPAAKYAGDREATRRFYER